MAVLRRGNGTGRILIRADMDAPPIAETSGLDHASATPGAMHACGHDGATAILLGAALYLAEHGGFSCEAVFLFQPNEKHGLGARAMLDDGVLDRFPADKVYALHNLPGAPLGQVSTRIGTICASETLFEIAIRGGTASRCIPAISISTTRRAGQP